MKVVLFCGGLGLRMRVGDDSAPKPMMTIGDRPGAVARHAVLRALRAHRVHPLPGLRRPGGQGVLPQLPGDRLQRLRAVQGRAAGRAAQHRHQRLDDHLRRHRAATPRSASGCVGSARTSSDDEVFLANYGDVLTDAPMDEIVDRVRATDATSRQPARRAAARARSTSSTSTTTTGSPASSRPPT